MPGNGEIVFEHRGIGDVLAQNFLAVPLNQREFSWEEEHVTDLLQDLANAIANNQSSYFLGTIVLTKGSGNVPEVSDGQQRLATATILLAAIRDYFFRNNDHQRANSIESDFLRTTDIDTTSIVPKLRLNVDDNEFFTKFILSSPDHPDRKITPSKESHQRIKLASEIAAKHIQSILEPYQANVRTVRLVEWVKFVRTGAKVIVLRVPDHLNAFMMFETLNDRGLKISQADLLKNHLLSYAGDRLSEAQQYWAKMIGVLESLGQDDVTVTYLHHFMITKTGPTTAREVFDKVRRMVDSQNRAMEFLNEIADGANDYAAIYNSDHTKWNGYGTRTRKHIATINRDLRVMQVRPLMFAVARHFSVKEAQDAFRLLVYWSVRFLIVGGRGGFLDRNYAVQANEIGAKKIKTAKALADAMADVVPSDTLFEAAIAEARVSHVYLARYYLRAMERYEKREPEPEWEPQDDEQAINLEHVMPEHAGNNWPDVDPETAAANYKRLGNMALLQAKKNSMNGNDSFKKKKPVLKESTFLLTSEIGNNTTWGVKEINERQKRLARIAVQTWPSKL